MAALVVAVACFAAAWPGRKVKLDLLPALHAFVPCRFPYALRGESASRTIDEECTKFPPQTGHKWTPWSPHGASGYSRTGRKTR